MKKEKELVFTCRKCGHSLYLTNWKSEKQMKKLLKLDCPNCGEEPDELWILTRFDVFKG